MSKSALIINYNIFEEFVEFKYINCNIKKVETPLEMTKLLDKSKLINKLFKEEKDYTKIKSFRESNLTTLINLFTSLKKDKDFLKNIIMYLKKVKIKCKKEYNKYTQKLVQLNLLCDEKNLKKMKNTMDKNNYLLNEIIIKFTNYIIKNIDITKKIINIEKMRYNIVHKSYTIMIIDMETFDIYFSFILIKNHKFILPDKYEIIKKELIKLYEEIKQNSISKIYNENNYKQLTYLDKLYEKYINLYCKLLEDIVNDKVYIKLFVEYIKLLKEEHNKDYTEHVKKIINYIEFLKNLKYDDKRMIFCFRDSIKKLLKFINKI